MKDVFEWVVCICITAVVAMLLAWGWDYSTGQEVHRHEVKMARIEACASAENVDACLALVR